MNFKFNKGKHRARPFYWLGWFPLLYKPRVLIRKLWLDNSCKYTFNTDDQWDVNKLFGLAFAPWSIHKNSVRLGYRYNPNINKFEILAYWYDDGVRSFEKICEIVCFRNYNCKIEISLKYYTIIVTQDDNNLELGRVWVPFRKEAGKFSFLLGPFFGGNRPAPHNMNFKLDKI